MHRPRVKQIVQPRRVDANPKGNREERRMAKKLDSKRSDGRERQEDQWVERKVT